MNKTLTFLSLIMFAFGLTVANGHTEETMSMTKGFDRPYEVSGVMGTFVKSPQGEYLGRIDDFVFDTEGRISFAILAHGGFLKFGEKRVAIPFNALSYNKEPKHFVLDVTREKLESAPAFSRRTLGDPQWAEDAYRYFGQQPYWTERGFKGGAGETMKEEHTIEFEYIFPYP